MQNAAIGIFTALMGMIFVTISVFMSRANFCATFGPIGSIGQADQGWEKSIGLIGSIGQGWLIDCRVTSTLDLRKLVLRSGDLLIFNLLRSGSWASIALRFWVLLGT